MKYMDESNYKVHNCLVCLKESLKSVKILIDKFPNADVSKPLQLACEVFVWFSLTV